MELYYINSDGTIIDFTKPPYLAKDISGLLDYDWECIVSHGRIFEFERKIAEIPLTINVLANTEEEYKTVCNYLFEALEKDVLGKVKGKLYYNGQYVSCNLIGNKKKDWIYGLPFMLNYFKLVTDNPFWYKEKTYHFYKSTQETIDSGNHDEVDNIIDNSEVKLDYPLDYPRGYRTKYRPAKKHYLMDYKYDYHKNHTVGRLDNDHFAASDFKMFIYGPCLNPEIRIGENVYRVFTTLYDSEYMVIDSLERTVVRYAVNGVKENLFNKRDKQNNLFKKIPTGQNSVKWAATYPFDVILFQERSEPAWI